MNKNNSFKGLLIYISVFFIGRLALDYIIRGHINLASTIETTIVFSVFYYISQRYFNKITKKNKRNSH